MRTRFRIHTVRLYQVEPAAYGIERSLLQENVVNLRVVMHVLVMLLATAGLFAVAPVIAESPHRLQLGLGIAFATVAIHLLNVLALLKK
jgi:hypothetical protein